MKVNVESEAKGIAIVTIDNKPMNALHPTVLYDLFAKLKELHKDEKVKAIVITGANGLFSAGFDIMEFKNKEAQMDGSFIIEEFCHNLEEGRVPTVAAIDGLALGGGCEIAIACNARICTPKSKLGLPELNIGVIPGFGGTQRLPRLIGLKKALEMMITSKMISAPESKQLGLIDEIVPRPELLIKTAISHALKIAHNEIPRVITLEKKDKIMPVSTSIQLCKYFSEMSKKKVPFMQHHQYCIEAVQHGIENGGKSGLLKEVENFKKCQELSTHGALLHIFLSMRATKKIKGLTDLTIRPRRLQKVGILGGGLMGSGIATSLLMAGCEVYLKEINEEFLNKGIQSIKKNIENNVKKSRISRKQAEEIYNRLHGVLDYNMFNVLDIVIEAVIEDVNLKQTIFSDLEKNCRPECILATNTSTIDINRIGERTNCQERIVGAHFFSPAHIMPLLEIIKTQHTSKQVLIDMLTLANKIKKTPVIVGNCTGFAVNRVFFPYSMASHLLVDLGLSPYKIDQVISKKFGMPLGPFRLSDLVGTDISVYIGKNYKEAYSGRVYLSQLMPLMAKYKRLGEKTKKGFYIYDDHKQATEDIGIDAILNEAREASSIKTSMPVSFIKDDEIIQVIMYPVINEACRVISEGIVDKASDLDIASILGMGFPMHLGGLMYWAKSLGAKEICSKLEMFSGFIPDCHAFFKPSPYLLAAANDEFSF